MPGQARPTCEAGQAGPCLGIRLAKPGTGCTVWAGQGPGHAWAGQAGPCLGRPGWAMLQAGQAGPCPGRPVAGLPGQARAITGRSGQPCLGRLRLGSCCAKGSPGSSGSHAQEARSAHQEATGPGTPGHTQAAAWGYSMRLGRPRPGPSGLGHAWAGQAGLRQAGPGSALGSKPGRAFGQARLGLHGQ
ncbi:spidroin-2-like [Homarus americanus]|uniref:spidroin-2-like n=1 Tax=Homarus americanus TaxID=6706 RepID=UPI001C465332|nr:spidroin-2-like [Homarus americanus]